ncbi:hypothetical protein [Acetobacterium tundrae]|uniref:Uncharacterized protein n=1 Tax=Acetobacterium tundrae TaxID=132932 RepID=A0ABR6WL35_9FIRM|nr:hypothetical protein [Acetobacterium tundrae]MBC3797159.1 hypothetical protein [Acetobacterium tundrae]
MNDINKLAKNIEDAIVAAEDCVEAIRNGAASTDEMVKNNAEVAHDFLESAMFDFADLCNDMGSEKSLGAELKQESKLEKAIHEAVDLPYIEMEVGENIALTITRSSRFHEMAQGLSAFIKSLPLSAEQNNQLVGMVEAQVVEAEETAAKFGFDTAAEFMDDNNVLESDEVLNNQ